MFWCAIGSVILIAVGILAFLRPDLIWKWTEQWKSYAADEPSELYVISTKIGGIAFLAFGIAVMVLPFILK